MSDRPDRGAGEAPDVLDTTAAGPLVIRGGILRALGYGTSSLLALLGIAMVTRHLGVADFGRFQTVIALITVVATLTDAGMATLGLPMSMSTWSFGRTVGHLAASDQVVSLEHLLTSGELGPGDRLLMLGVGPGITLSCAVIEIISSPPWT